MKYDWVVFSLTFAPYSALFGEASVLLSPGFLSAAAGGWAVFGFSPFWAKTGEENGQRVAGVGRNREAAKGRTSDGANFIFAPGKGFFGGAKNAAYQRNLPK